MFRYLIGILAKPIVNWRDMRLTSSRIVALALVVTLAIVGIMVTTFIVSDDCVIDPSTDRIAFTQMEHKGLQGPVYDIYLADANSGCVAHLFRNSSHPAWSPDGTRMAFTQVSTGTLIVSHIDGGRSNFKYGGRTPFWSPDGSRIAFFIIDRVYVIKYDGSIAARLAGHPHPQGNPKWSPDGSRIALVTSDAGRAGLFVFTVEDRVSTHLVNGPNISSDPGWSPDGMYIAFAMEDTSLSSSDLDIYVISSDGGTPTPLTQTLDTHDTYPSWSPDGSKIVFVSRLDDNSGISLMNSDGTEISHLTHGKVDKVSGAPQWSPDGTRIAFEGYDSESRWDIYVVNADGSGLVQLTDHPGDELHPAWAPN